MLQEADPQVDPLSGETFGKYVLLKRLAVGGMAEVYLANLLGAAGFTKLVVLKLVLPRFASDSHFVELFLDEARLAAQLSHPNIAQTFDLGEADGRYYIAMEYVMGETLSAWRRRVPPGERVPLPLTLRICAQLLEALDYAHEATDERGRALGVVHRDVTPTNVLVTYHGSVKLVDFGIARAATQHHETQVGVVRGRMGFMAPEQCTLTAPVDRRTDVFAAGAILYTLAVGQEPYPRYPTLMEGMLAMREARFPAPRQIRPDLPEALERIILRAMQVSASDRYPTAAVMLAELEQYRATLGPAPTARELADYARSLFPDRALLASSLEGEVDSKTLVDLLSVSDQDILPLEELRAPPATVPMFRPKPLPRWRRPLVLGAAAVLGAAVGVAALTGALTRPQRPVAEPPRQVTAPPAAEPVRSPPEAKVASPQPAPPAVPLPPPPPASPPPVVRAIARRQPKASPTPGWLKIDTYPWAHVREGSEELGVTPLRAELPAGKHLIRLENEQLRLKRSVWITIRPGEETRYSTGLDQAPP